LVIAVATTVAVSLGFHPDRAGTRAVLLIFAGVYGTLVVGALVWLWRRGELQRQLTPSRGDITIGALLAVVLYLVATLGHRGLTVRGSPREPWIMRVYLQIGDPRLTVSFTVGMMVLALAASEEIVWRGVVQRLAVERLGEVRGFLVALLLYVGAHAPTIMLLGDPNAGPNPLVVGAALGCGVVWGYLALRSGRLFPSVVAHALFSWAIVEFPVWRM
jgi:membrane protease YdiL (CAAX protease family)